MSRKHLKTLFKLAVSASVTTYVVWKVLHNESLDDLADKVAAISWPLVAMAFLAQAAGMASAITRWRFLLLGQGIQVPWKHLIGTFLVGRFVGSFTPSTTGLDGWRMYEVARDSGATARSISSILVEKVIGFFVLAVLVLVTLPWGVTYLGRSNIVLVGIVTFCAATFALGVLLRPGLVRRIFDRLPEKLRRKGTSTLDAVTAYGNRKRDLLLAVVFGFPVHILTIVIYLFTARALGVDTPLLDLAFVSLLVIAATLLPVSIAGVGVREGTFVGLLGLVGVSASAAALTGFIGYLCGEAISLFGGLILLARPADYRMAMRGEGVRDREERAEERAKALPMQWRPAIQQGLAAGLLAGVFLGLGEATLVLVQAAPPRDLTVLPYAAVTYGIATAFAGAALAVVLAWWTSRAGRVLETARLWASVGAVLFSGLGFVVVRFRIFRDVFHENLRATSAKGLAVQAGIAVVAFLVFWVGRRVALRLVRPRAGRMLLRTWGSPAAAGLVAGVVAAVSFLGSPSSSDGARAAAGRGHVSTSTPNVVVAVVDTLRVDAVSAYGGSASLTPNLDALAREGVLFEWAFAQSSWTRPSFATILSGRYASSHRSMYKTDELPDEVVTLPEALRDEGWATAGFVTNYNVAPYFNFDQGFDEYHYLEPDLVLWANDTASRLALYSAVRLVWERIGGASMRPSRFYRDARETTDQALAWIGRRPERAPFFLFVGYMDPHDPYFPHPYDGTGFARVANPRPALDEADEIRALYDGEVRFWDRHFGRLVRELRALPGRQSGSSLLDETILVVTSDHGEEFAEHGGFWHGTTLYDEQIHVPLVARLPRGGSFGDVAGTRSADWVGLVDVAPTVLGLVGVDVPRGMQGGDLFANLGADTPSRRPVFAEEDHEGNQLMSIRQMSDGAERKLILANAGNPRGLPARELFDTAADPGEREDLSNREGDRASRIEHELARMAELAAEGAVRASRIGLDEGSVERLKSLGYVQ